MQILAMHGTSSKNKFELNELKRPVYFTDNAVVADFFTRKRGRIMYAILEMEEPYIIDWQGHSWGGGFIPKGTDGLNYADEEQSFDNGEELFKKFVEYASNGDPEEVEYWTQNGLCVDMFASLIERKGYDGLIVFNVYEECGCSNTVYAAFKNTKVRNIEPLYIRTLDESSLQKFKKEVEERFSPYTPDELPLTVKYISGTAAVDYKYFAEHAFLSGITEDMLSDIGKDGSDNYREIKFHGTLEEAVEDMKKRRPPHRDPEVPLVYEPFAGAAVVMANGLITGFPVYAAVQDIPPLDM